MVKVAFTGSFDPPHVGHIYVVNQAKKLGFEVMVVVANNPAKTYANTLDERLDLAHLAFSDADHIISCDAENIGETIKRKGCAYIVRGLRDAKDFEYERTVEDWNRENNRIETFYISCPPMLRNISSTKIKSTQNNG